MIQILKRSSKMSLASISTLSITPESFMLMEKSQIQALERLQLICHCCLGVPERKTHDYYRHATTTLFAALNILSGKVIANCKKRNKATDQYLIP